MSDTEDWLCHFRGVSTPSATQHELLGLTLAGSLPLGRVHLRLARGLTVLFGVNGAGKTRTLAEASATLAGHAPDSEEADRVVHLRITDPEMPLTGAFGDALVTAAANVHRSEDEPAPDWFKPTSEGGAVAWLDLVEHVLADESLPEGVLEQVAFGGALSCYAVGSARAPRWEIWIASTEILFEYPAYKDPRPLTLSPAVVIDKSRDARAAALNGDDRRRSQQIERWRSRYSSEQVPKEQISELMALFSSQNLTFDKRRHIALLNGETDDRAGDETHITPWPDWLPLPLVRVGVISVAPVSVWQEAPTSDDLGRLTMDLLLDGPARDDLVVEVANGEDLVLTNSFGDLVRRLEGAANAIAQSIIPTALDLRLDMRGPGAWLRGAGPHWMSVDIPTGEEVALEALSQAQRRWASLAIALALRELTAAQDGLPFVALADEPEAGLHRQLESRLASGLSALGQRLNAALVVASHSPALLNETSACLVDVRRRETDGRTVLAPLSMNLNERARLSETAARFGTDVADMLQLLRVVLIVEGEHDDAIVAAFLAEDLLAASAWVIPLRGAANAPGIADAHLLFDATFAHMVVMLDNVDHDLVRDCWRQLQQAVEEHDKPRAKRALRQLQQIRGAESQWLGELAERAVDTDRILRIHPYGLAQPDVIFYLPVTDFVPSARSWDELHGEYLRWRAGQPPPRPGRAVVSFKAWLRRCHQQRSPGRRSGRALGGSPASRPSSQRWHCGCESSPLTLSHDPVVRSDIQRALR